MEKQRQAPRIDRTVMAKKEEVQLQWFVVDASDKILGRLASEIAKILRGKHTPKFTPHVDCGGGVIVVNADKVRVTGNKEAQKVYRRHTGRPGGLKETTYRTMKERKPEYIIEHAVKGMVPRTRLGRKQMTRLRVCAGTKHGMEAQQPITVNV